MWRATTQPSSILPTSTMSRRRSVSYTHLSEIIRIMEKYPWCDGIDIDLERGDGYSTHAASTAMFMCFVAS